MWGVCALRHSLEGTKDTKVSESSSSELRALRVLRGEIRFASLGRRFGALSNELQGDAVVAPALPCRFRAVVKNMAMVAAATDAVVFGARQDQLVIGGLAE